MMVSMPRKHRHWSPREKPQESRKSQSWGLIAFFIHFLPCSMCRIRIMLTIACHGSLKLSHGNMISLSLVVIHEFKDVNTMMQANISTKSWGTVKILGNRNRNICASKFFWNRNRKNYSQILFWVTFWPVPYFPPIIIFGNILGNTRERLGNMTFAL